MITHKKAEYADITGERESFLKDLKNSRQPGVLIHTCHRVEFYGGTGLVPENVALHLFRLVSGLESRFIGETFIQGQVKDAYHKAAAEQKLDASIHRLFQWAFLAGKRVRTETAISRGAMSHSHAVVEIIKQVEPEFQNRRFTFIGINKMNQTIMNFLKGNIYNTFILCNRNFEKALNLENHFNCKAFKLNHLKQALEQSDIVISGTSAPHVIVKREHISPGHPLLIFDLAVPCDVEADVQNLREVKYFGLNKIEHQVDGNKSVRSTELIKAESIIDDEVSRFMNYQRKRESRLNNKALLQSENELVTN